MKELISKVFDTKMQDGTIEGIVSDHFDKMVSAICNDLMGWNGDIKRQIQEKIKPIMLQSIEESDLGSLTAKITALINANLKNSSLENYANVLNFKEIFDTNEAVLRLDGRQRIAISDLFKEYIKHIESIYGRDDFEDDEINYDDGAYASIECTMSVIENGKRPFWQKKSDYTVEFHNEKSDDERSTNVRFKLVWNYDGTRLYLRSEFSSMPMYELRYCPSFFLYLFAIENKCIEIEIDGEEDCEDAVFDFEE